MRKFHISLSIIILSFFPLIVFSCKDSTSVEPGPTEINTIISDEHSDDASPSTTTLIVDRTGKSWDITFGVTRFGMEPRRFHFGLGPNAIPPILNPIMLSPGDPEYPDDSERIRILGVKLNGSARAYPLDGLVVREVADEKFGAQHVAVSY